MKKIISVAVALLAAASLFVGCSKSNVKKIGVIQFIEHPALDASYQGFVDGLKEAGFVDGENIKIDYHNAQGDMSNCTTIAQKLISDNDDLIFAIATSAAQAVANLTSTIPIVITAVTDPEDAKLVKANIRPETNVTGTSDLTPCAEQIQMLKKLYPDAKTVAMLYNSAETNSVFQIEMAKAECDKLGLSYIDATVSNSNEIQQVVQSVVGKVDAIYTPTDNIIASAMGTVALVTNDAKIPVICGEDGMVQAGGLATYGINYYLLGKQTAVMAVDVLNGRKPQDMPIQYQEKIDFTYNKEVAEILGFSEEQMKALAK